MGNNHTLPKFDLRKKLINVFWNYPEYISICQLIVFKECKFIFALKETKSIFLLYCVLGR